MGWRLKGFSIKTQFSSHADATVLYSLYVLHDVETFVSSGLKLAKFPIDGYTVQKLFAT